MRDDQAVHTVLPAFAPQPSAVSGHTDPVHAFVAVVARSIDFYRGLGCEIRLVADGWVQLTHDGTVLVLQEAPVRMPPPTAPLIRLGCGDLRALREFLWARGIATLGHGRAHEFEVIDPDGHRVIVSEHRNATDLSDTR